MDRRENFSVFLMVALLAFAVVLVDDRVLRTAMAVLPALMLAQKALGGAQQMVLVPEPAEERRTDEEVRRYIEQLLKYFREFYTTCHLMGAGVLTAEAAEERTASLERDLNRLLAEVTSATRTRGGAAADGTAPAGARPSPEVRRPPGSRRPPGAGDPRKGPPPGGGGPHKG